MIGKKIFIKIFVVTLCAGLLTFSRFTATENESSEEEIRVVFQNARKNIYKKEWQKAVAEFRKIAAEYTDSKYIDDSLYWLGYSLNKLSKNSGNFEKQLMLQKEALAKLETLRKRFPTSNWTDDAELLIVEIAEDLAGKGLKQYKKLINEIAAKEQDREIKMAAIDSLFRTDREKAFPILEKIISEGEDARLKEKAIFVLSQSRDERAIPLFVDTALKDGSLKIREQAIFWLGQLRNPASLKALTKLYKTIDEEKLQEKIIFSIFQNGSKEAIKQLIEIYKNEKNLKLKKTIILWMGQSRSKEAETFIKEILNN